MREDDELEPAPRRADDGARADATDGDLHPAAVEGVATRRREPLVVEHPDRPGGGAREVEAGDGALERRQRIRHSVSTHWFAEAHRDAFEVAVEHGHAVALRRDR